jgi:DNA repair protein RadC
MSCRKLKPSARLTEVAEGAQFRMAFYEPIPAGAELTTKIAELPLSEQPVMRLIYYGPGAVSVIELLTIVCGFGDLHQAQELLTKHGSLPNLARAPLSELAELRGFGERKAAHLKAVFELGRRLLTAAPTEHPTVKSPADVANLLMLEMAALEQEQMRTVILNTKNVVLKIHTCYVGSLNTAVIRVGELFREAIRLNAAALIAVHNHPSGDPTPSAEDVCVTRQIVEAGKLLNIDVLDHIVVGQQRWVSLKERGLGF